MTSNAEDARSDKSCNRSVRSSGSRKYKVVSRGSDVDESLFGVSSKLNPGNSSQQNTSAKKVLMADVPSKATIITKNELARMKQRAIITSLADEKAEQLAREKDLEEKQKAARDRKQRMLGMEVEAKAKALKSDIEIEKLARDAIVRRLATEKLDDNNDMVKLINSLGASAAAFMIRDEQLQEKKKYQKLEKDYEERMDMIMELDRLKDLTMRDAQEQERKNKRIEDRKAITEQIEARRRDNLIRLEAREQENQAMLAAMKRYAEADKVAAEKRAVEMRKARELVMAANDEAIYKRKAAREKEKEEVEAVLAYQAMKDEEMRLREVAEAEKKQIMKNRQQKLLEGQQRDMDKRAELDELRARRAAEEKEREMRKREQNSIEKQRRDTLQLQVDRRRQADSKKAYLAREADLEKEEYDAVLRHKAKLAERERREDEAKHAANMEHRRAILQQMQDAEDKRKAERIAKIEEGRRCKQERIKEHVKLEAMRERMVDDLEKRGISPKYLAEMKAVDIPKLIMR